jgi:GntR family transcriptional regulator / MocR family aminotransferase
VRFDLSSNTPDVSLFPVRRWSAAVVQAIRSAPASAYDFGPPRGDQELRKALGDHLGWTRGVVTDPDRIVVVSGAAQGIDLLSRLLAAAGGRRVAEEDPSLDSQPTRFGASGLDVVGQPVDSQGLVVEGLAANAVLVTPAHQFPTGAVLSGPRRRRLLEWARGSEALVIEDDYDAEFRYRVPVPALRGIDPDRVVYLGTASNLDHSVSGRPGYGDRSMAGLRRPGWLNRRRVIKPRVESTG